MLETQGKVRPSDDYNVGVRERVGSWISQELPIFCHVQPQTWFITLSDHLHSVGCAQHTCATPATRRQGLGPVSTTIPLLYRPHLHHTCWQGP